MLSAPRDLALALLKTTAPLYPMRWVDELTSRGDFEGREFAVDIFNVPTEQQEQIRRDLRSTRKAAQETLGKPIVLVFHTPEATAKHYRPLVETLARIENAVLDSPLVLRTHERLSQPFFAYLGPISISLKAAA